ncbi:hypothetical protein DIJ64_11200 [Mycobacterium leprae]|uniref:Uncharacterized protein n=1 Tax=Mycobacterium leprae TaxID=1769 RepID=A0AAD2JE03_MYCLR|nr:hypothetical protein DIJ64_11200 [Mycobacterium leprae]
MFRLSKLAGDTAHIVVTAEVQQRKARQQLVVSLQRLTQLDEVAIAAAALELFPQLVLGDGVASGGAGHGCIIAVNELADAPSIRMQFADFWYCCIPEYLLYSISCI